MTAPVPPAELILASRTWRLAILTTGDAEVARRALAALPPVHPHDHLDASRLDRLAIQALRRAIGRHDRAPATDAVEPPPRARARRDPVSLGPAHDVLGDLPPQAAEAWVLRRLDDLDPIRACRAMDCSRSAADRFLARADEELAARLGQGRDSGVAALRAASDALAPDPHVVAICQSRARDRHRRGVTLALSALAAILTLLLLAALALR